MRGWIDAIALLCAFAILLGYTAYTDTHKPVYPDEVLLDVMTDLYTWNYVETSNPTKRIRLQAALQKLEKEYKCDILTAQPDLKKQCKPARYDILERLRELYKESK